MRYASWKFIVSGLGLLGLAALTVACGSSSSAAKLRLVNANPDQSGLNLLVDTNSATSGVGYGAASSYIGVSAASHEIQVEPNTTSTPIIDTTLNFSSGSNVSLVSANYSYNPMSIVLNDDNSTPPSGDFKLRILNVSPGMGAQDVYVVTSGSDIGSANPVFDSLGFGSASSYVTLTAGNYDVVFTPPGSKFTNLTTSLTLSAGQIRTVLALNNPVGSYLATVLSDLN
ncbi:MAG TPA: DUF4397 domain-containing protein [Terriglobales bacterium]|nr:DUF4397 domain-containing protein [Terriglobales bacterium]